jgi:peroxiredoxin
VRDARPELTGMNVFPVDINPDAVETRKKFDERHHLEFILLLDREHKAAEASVPGVRL